MALSRVVSEIFNVEKYRELEIRVRDRSATYDSLLTFHSNHGISHRFREIRRFQSKIANFSHLLVFYAPADGVPLAWN